MATTVEQVVNQALVDAGIRYRVADIYEGSPEAKVALEVFGQTRDEILRLADWSFSRRVAPLVLLKGPPPVGGYTPLVPWSNIYPNPGFLFEYDYPSDCLDLRAIANPPGLMPDLDPRPAVWRVDNDPTPNVSGNPPVASGPAQKVILTNKGPNAIVTYRASVTDPTEWDSGFIAALTASLGQKFTTAFGGGVDKVREQRTEAIETTQTAADVRG